MSENAISTVSPDLIRQANNANNVCCDAYRYFSKRDAILSGLSSIQSSRKTRITIILILLFLCIGPFTLFTIGGACAGPEGIIALFFLYAFAIFCAVGIGVICHFHEKSLKKQEEDIRNRADAEHKKGEEILLKNENFLTILPPKYRFPIATGYILEMLQTGRAKSIGEALDRTDEHLHRLKLEKNSTAALTFQITQLETLKQIERNTFWDLI